MAYFFSLKPGKLTRQAQQRVIPKCGLIDPSVYPREGSKARLLWRIADEITAERSRLPTTKEVQRRGKCNGLKVSMIEHQLSKWRKAHPSYRPQDEWDS